MYKTNLADELSYKRIIFENGEETLKSEKEAIENLKTNYNVITCPLETPFYGASDPQNLSTKSCISCDEGYVFDFKGL